MGTSSVILAAFIERLKTKKRTKYERKTLPNE